MTGNVYNKLEPVDVSGDKWTSPLPLGPESLLYGVLDNGVTYYVRPCPKPKERAALALVVKVGSVVEEDHEAGVAHIVEHLAFNATDAFSNHQIVKFLESIGASFGACQNAYTSSDETCYQLVIPVGARPAANLDTSPAAASPVSAAAAEGAETSADAAGTGASGSHAAPDGADAAADSSTAAGPSLGDSTASDTGSSCDAPAAPATAAASTATTPVEGAAAGPGGVGTHADGAAAVAQDLKLLQDAVGVLAQFAFHIRCAAGDLAKERGAVLEEWRMSRNAAGRAAEAHWRLIMQGSRYEDRLPIGKEAVVKGVTADTVKAFYQRWYRPENMAVVAVGDFARPSDVVALIRAAFNEERSQDTSPARPVPQHPYCPHTAPRLKVFVDRELQDSQVWLSYKYGKRDMAAPADFVVNLERWVFQEVVNTRLFKLSRLPDPPFADASISDDPLTASTNSRVLAASAMEGQALRALECLLTEMARLRLHGISPRQFRQAMADIKSDIENTYLERDQAYAWDIRDEYCRNFLHGEFVIGQELEARLSKTLLSHVTKEAVEGYAAHYLPTNSCVIKVTEHRQHLTEADLAAVVARVAAAEAKGLIGPWDGDAELPEQLIAGELQPVPREQAVVKQRSFPLLGVTELTLANGMRIALKPTTFMDDEVMLSGVAFGGLTEVPPDQYHNASTANNIAGQLGVFGLKPHILNDFLAGQRADLSIQSSAFGRYLSGSTSPQDLEVLLQLVHLLFTTQVKADAQEAAVVMRLMRQRVAANLRNPSAQYESRCRLVNYGDSYYFRPITMQDMDAMDMEAAVAHHNKSYRNPAEFTLVFTGNVSEEVLLPLVLKYLATLPALSDPEPQDPARITPLQWTPASKPVVEDVKVSMVSPITQAQVTFPVTLPRPRVREDVLWLNLMCMVLETRLLQRMRFTFGEIYTVAVSPSFGCEAISNPGDVRGDVSVSFTCDPANRLKLVNIVLEEASKLQTEGVTEQEVQTVKTLERLQYEESRQENRYWHDTVVTAYQSKSYLEVRDIDVVHQRSQDARAKVLAECDPATLQEAARRILPFPCRSLYTAVCMVPRPPSLLQRAATALWCMVSRREPPQPAALPPAASLPGPLSMPGQPSGALDFTVPSPSKLMPESAARAGAGLQGWNDESEAPPRMAVGAMQQRWLVTATAAVSAMAVLALVISRSRTRAGRAGQPTTGPT